MCRMTDIRRLTVLAALALSIAACTGSTVSISPSASPKASQAPAATSSAATATSATATSAVATGQPGTPASGQTDTAWGRIWDSLPADFPMFPGSAPSDEASTGAASATLVVDGDVARAVATTTESKLKAGGYHTDGLSGPLEDGSYTLEMTGAEPGCRVTVTAKPTGGLTTVTILYGSACPAP